MLLSCWISFTSHPPASLTGKATQRAERQRERKAGRHLHCVRGGGGVEPILTVPEKRRSSLRTFVLLEYMCTVDVSVHFGHAGLRP